MNNYEEIKVPFNVLILSNDPARIDDDGVLDVSSLDSSYVSLCVKVQGKKVKHLVMAKIWKRGIEVSSLYIELSTRYRGRIDVEPPCDVKWFVKMKALLEHQILAAPLEELPAANVILKKAYSILILCLGDRVLREITKEMLQQGFGKSKGQSQHIDEFHKLVGDLAAIVTTVSDEDQALLLLTSFPLYYDNFVETLLFGRDTLNLEDVLTTLNSRELLKMTRAKGDVGEGLYVMGRFGQRDIEYNHKKSKDFIRNEDQIIDLGGSYHMTYMRDFLVYFEEYDSGNVSLGDGHECCVRGTEGFTVKMQLGKIKVIKGSLVVLSGTRRANCVYTLDGKAVTRKTLKGIKQLEEYQTRWKIKTDYLVNEQENVHLGIKVGTNIMVTGVPGQEGAKGNVVEKKKVKESVKANIGKILKYNAWSTRWSLVRGCGDSVTKVHRRYNSMVTTLHEDPDDVTSAGGRNPRRKSTW
ncbi:hypothetical protein Tco_0515359 [Tanacetum coccineum]